MDSIEVHRHPDFDTFVFLIAITLRRIILYNYLGEPVLILVSVVFIAIILTDQIAFLISFLDHLLKCGRIDSMLFHKSFIIL